jgi:hypothetical protein
MLMRPNQSERVLLTRITVLTHPRITSIVTKI